MSTPQKQSIRLDLDECWCGDFRRDHDENGCRLPHWFYGACRRFRLARSAQPDEIARQEKLEARLAELTAQHKASYADFEAGDIPMEAKCKA